VKPVKGRKLNEQLRDRIRKAIIANLSRRHVPAVMVECPEIPYTTTMKRVEVAVKKIVNVSSLNKCHTDSTSKYIWYNLLKSVVLFCFSGDPSKQGQPNGTSKSQDP
jgi:hypothetical protein